MKKLNKYHGVVVPMVTPVTKEGDIDVKAVERIIENFAKYNVSALLMGTTGEGNSVSVEQGVKMIEAAAKTANGRITIYTGLTNGSRKKIHRGRSRCHRSHTAQLLRPHARTNVPILSQLGRNLGYSAHVV